MISIAGDTHTHTVACGHALGTVTENAAYAARRGHRFLAVTEHCGTMPGAPSNWFFNNLLRNCPREIDGVVLIKGAEANIVDVEGTIDFPDTYMRRLDLIIASAHEDAFEECRWTGKPWPKDRWTPEQFTEMYLRAAANPLVDIIGHCGNPCFPFDHDRVIREFKKYDKIVEINSCSPRARAGSENICPDIIRLCKKYEVKVSVGSDAHSPQTVGELSWAAGELEKAGFPAELVVNADYSRMREEIMRRKGIELPE